jgi:aldehyde:ferredoxin oxidoreductase
MFSNKKLNPSDIFWICQKELKLIGNAMKAILRIDMGAEGSATAREEPLGVYKGLGGRALTSAVVAREVPPLCHPLGADNKIIFAPGLLGGTPADMTGRLSVGFKSPLTGGIKEANAGGSAAQILARLGYAALILEGQPKDDAVYKISISKEGVKISANNSLKMLGNYELVDSLIDTFSSKIAVISIGPVGEMKMAAASIACTDTELKPTRHAGRGGGGAVMGSKGVKVIILDGEGVDSIVANDRDRFANASKVFSGGLKRDATTSLTLPRYGTANMVDFVDEAGGFPTRYFTSGRFEGASRINAIALTRLEQERGGSITEGCHVGCIVRCSGTYNDSDGDYVTKQPEYETIWAHGANCGIDDMDAIAQLDQLDDDYGIDTIEMGNAIAVAMAAGLVEFGDAQKAIDLVDEVGRGTAMGRILGAGAAVAGRILGIEKIAAVKGQALPAYDPRVLQGLGVTFATSPMGADHTAGFVFESVLDSNGEIDPLKVKEQVVLSRKAQIDDAALDATGLCQFVATALADQPETFQAMLELINSLHGWTMTAEDYFEMGCRILKTERSFNIEAGFTNEHDRLPDFFKKDAVAPHNMTFQIDDRDLDSVFNE